jgi:hypothetical protein
VKLLYEQALIDLEARMQKSIKKLNKKIFSPSKPFFLKKEIKFIQHKEHFVPEPNVDFVGNSFNNSNFTKTPKVNSSEPCQISFPFQNYKELKGSSSLFKLIKTHIKNYKQFK